MARCKETKARYDSYWSARTHRTLWSTREGKSYGDVGGSFPNVVTQELRATQDGSSFLDGD